jgi:TusA-related sulfurtransferase
MTNDQRVIVDARNVACSALWLAIPEVRRSFPGNEVEIWYTDPKDGSDIAKWGPMVNNEVVNLSKEEGFGKIILRKLA